MVSEKLEKRKSEHSPDSRYDDVDQQNVAALPPQMEECIQQGKKQDEAAGGKAIFSRLGDLPEWNVPGVGLLHGKALNNAIAWTSCLAFLMFGYVSQIIARYV